MNASAHTKRERSPWAFISILLVVLLFGLFWLWQRSKFDKSIPAPVMYQATVPRTSNDETPDLSALEASAVNIAIPSFEKVF